MEMLFALGGFVIGGLLVGLVGFFVAKNNRNKLLAAFDEVEGLPSDMKSAIKGLSKKAKDGLKKLL